MRRAAACGEDDINRNACAAQALEQDPLLEKLKIYPEYERLKAAAAECQAKLRR